MHYWLSYNPTNGAIGKGSSTHPPVITTSSNGETTTAFDTSLLNGATLIGWYNDSAMPSAEQAAYANTQAYLYQSGTFVTNPNWAATELAQAVQAQIAALNAGYTNTINSGFNATVGTTSYTFGWKTDDKANLLAVQEAVTDGLLSFPVLYSTITGSPVSIPDQTTLTAIKQKATSFFGNQHQQILTLVGQVEMLAATSDTTVAQIQAIVWQAATY